MRPPHSVLPLLSVAGALLLASPCARGERPGVTAGGCARVVAVAGAALPSLATVIAWHADGLPLVATGLVLGDGDRLLVADSQVLDAARIDIGGGDPAHPHTAFVLAQDARAGLAVLSVDPPLPAAAALVSYVPLVGQVGFVVSVTPATDDSGEAGFATPFEITGRDATGAYLTELRARCGSLSGPAFNGSRQFIGWHLFEHSQTALLGPDATIAIAQALTTSGAHFRRRAGFSARDLSARLMEVTGRTGALVSDVEAATPAAAAGLKAGDIVVSADGVAVRMFSDLYDVLSRAAPGATVVLAILRDGQALELRIAIGDAG